MAFLRNLLATILGLFIFCFLILLIFSGIAASTDTVPHIKNNSILHMNLRGIVVEKAIDDPFQELLVGGPAPISLVDLLNAIEVAKDDDRIQGIYLEPQYLSAGFSSLQEIREALVDFKASGKFIYAYGEYLSEGDYYLASVADSIYLNPQGSLEFNGFSAGVTFFKGLFEKLDIEPQIFRVGDFKSFVEPFIRKSMSDENRLQMEQLLTSIHETYLQKVSESRGLSVETLEGISDQMKVRFPQDAVTTGLVSKVAYEDEILSVMKARTGVDEDDELTFAEYAQYIKATRNSGKYSGNKVAVILADGDIIMGESDGSVGGEQFAREIRKARENSAVKAIVLRVNSPGGSLTASDMIWREVMLTKGVKPIIASMSDVAASGGYYISMACDTIIAQPNTITGSIGIFGIMFYLGDFLENKLGITTDAVSTGEFSDMMTLARPLTDYEKSIIQGQVEEGYTTFVTKAAEGRGMSVDAIKEVAGGRVWSGAQAHERGLVDMIGTFDDAVELAAQNAGIEDNYMVSFYPRQKPFIEKIMSDFGGAKAYIYGGVETPLSPYIEDIKALQKMQGIQARLPVDLRIN